MAERRTCVTLTTDFGVADHFIGVMKGIILGINPAAAIVDLTHAVPAHDIAIGAYELSNSWRFFPRGTVHVAVVDPGVGSQRRAIALEADGHFFVGPDNGVLTPAIEQTEGAVREIRDVRYTRPAPSPTFHGRDVFAPVGAHLSRGVRLERLGPILNEPVRLTPPSARIEGSTIHAEVLHVDRFGNVILNIEGSHLARAGAVAGRRRLRATVGGRVVQTLVTHYAAAGGELCFIVNSDGRLEIALPGGSAARLLDLVRGTPIVIEVG